MTPIVHDPEFLAFQSLTFANPVIADVGANRGQSIESFKALYPTCIIHSFEPNPVHFAALAAWKEKYSDESVIIYRFGLGDTPSFCTFYIPEVDGVQYLEETSMDKSHFDVPYIKDGLLRRGSNVTFLEFSAPVSTGDSIEINADIIKIDVEGAELSVIKGFDKTIIKYRPIIFAENSDWNVYLHLTAMGYTHWKSDHEQAHVLKPFSGQRTNSFFIPEEKLERFHLKI